MTTIINKKPFQKKILKKCARKLRMTFKKIKIKKLKDSYSHALFKQTNK